MNETSALHKSILILDPYMNSKQLLQELLKLQSLDFDESELDEAGEKEMERKIAELRLHIPLLILNHYDRLVVRGKKGIAAVRNQTCTGCHVQVTRATVINLMHGEDIQVCENCGRYLYLAPAKEQASNSANTGKANSKLKKQPELSCAA